MPIPENSLNYPRLSPFDELGEQMIIFAKFGKIFSISVLLLMCCSPWVIFPIAWMADHVRIRNFLVGICILIGLIVIIVGIVVFALFILYISKLNDVAVKTRNYHLRNVFIMELVSMSVFIGLNIAGNIVVPLISRRLESFHMFNIYIQMPGLTFYLFVLLFESIAPRIFKVFAVSNLKKWSDNLGVLIYDPYWVNLKQDLSVQIRKMKIGQFFALIPFLSFIIPVIYYNGLGKTGRLFKKITPHMEKNKGIPR